MLERLRSIQVTKAQVLALLLAVAIMPWFQGGRDPIGWMMVLGVGLLGGFMLWRSPLVPAWGRLGWLWLALMAWSGLSLIWTVNRYQSFTTLMLYGFVGVIFLLASSLRQQPLAEAVFRWSYLLVASIASIVGLIFFITQAYDRATSTFYLPNPFAAFLLPIVLIGLWRFAEANQLLDGLLAMLNLGVLILTDSRGGLLVLAVCVFIGLWLSRQIFRHWRRLLIILAGAVAVALLANLARGLLTHHFNAQGSRFKEILSTESNSTGDRIYFTKSALAIWADHPFGGSGAGTYQTLHPKYQYRVISAGLNAHNYYVQILAELGLVGFGLIIWIVIELILGIVRGLKARPEQLPWALGLLALLLHAALDIDQLYLVLWALLAILAGFCYSPRRAKTAAVPVMMLPLAASLALALPTIWLFQNQSQAAFAKSLQDNFGFDKAIGYYALSHQHPPYNPDWLTAEGINHLVVAGLGEDKDNNLAKAANLARAAQKLDPADGQHDLLLARVLEAQDRLTEAEAALKSAITKDPYDTPAFYTDLATIYLRQQKFSAASATANRLIELYPPIVIGNRNNDESIPAAIATAYVISAQAQIAQGQLDLARPLLRQALVIDKTNSAAPELLKQIGQ